MPRVDRLYLNETLRYPKPAKPHQPELDGLKNFHYATRGSRSDSPAAMLESGINRIAVVGRGGQRGRPAILIRSSPWKAGTTSTPWHDSFELGESRVVYFGDHKSDTIGPLGSTPGNAALEEAWALHSSSSRRHRLAAPPLLIFRAKTWTDRAGVIRQKAAVDFIGLALISEFAPSPNVDPDSGLEFPNYRAVLRLMALEGRPAALDWSWINARREATLSLEESLSKAPASWRHWVDTGYPSMSA